jgi:hypothetical protein
MKPADVTDYDMLTFRMVQAIQRATNALTAAESEACQREADRLNLQRNSIPKEPTK